VDSVSNISRPSPFNFAAQTLVASHSGTVIKIDASSDTAAPGAGTGWINPGQATPEANGTNFIQANPAVVFTYTYHLNDVPATRTISSVFNPTAGRALSVYTSAQGAQTRLSANQVTVNAATITVIPTPSAAALVPLFGLVAARRVRPTT
jgi:hypothetical protein